MSQLLTQGLMLTSFTIENYRSIHSKVSLSLEASIAIKDNAAIGYTTTGSCNILNSISFYGANASGKSNLMRALSLMSSLVVHSVKLNDNEFLPYDPFLLSSGIPKPTTFEVSFIEDDIKYRYGFSYTRNRITREWLFVKRPRASEKHLLERVADEYDIDDRNFQEGVLIKNGTLDLNANRLFVSLAAQSGGTVSKKIIEWFRTKIHVISGMNDNRFARVTNMMLHDCENPLHGHVVDFLSSMDLGLDSLSTRQMDMDDINLPKGLPAELVNSLRGIPQISVISHHKVYDDAGDAVGNTEFDVEERESAGTNKLIHLAGPIASVLRNGSLLCIDELDAQLHPIISWRLVEMFNNPVTNIHGAQLLFTTHDTNLLSSRLFRRDQICFVEKSKTESTRLTPMMDITLECGHKPRSDSNYEKNYLEGKYGAIPYLKTDSPDLFM